MKFHVCEFNNHEVGIIPQKWLTKEDAAKCWYPPEIQQTMTTVQKALTPQKNWNIYGVKRTFKVTENLSEAVKLMDHYANTSATDEASPKAKKQKHNKEVSSPLNIPFPIRDNPKTARLAGKKTGSPAKRRLSFEKSTTNKKIAAFPINITSNTAAIQKELLLTTPEKSTVESDADSPVSGKKRISSRFSPSYAVDDYSEKSDDSDVSINSSKLSLKKQTKNVKTDDQLKEILQPLQSPHNGKSAIKKSSNIGEKPLTTLQKLADEYNSPSKQSPSNKSPKRMQLSNTNLASAESPHASTSNEHYDFSINELSPIVPFRSSTLNPDTLKTSLPSTSTRNLIDDGDTDCGSNYSSPNKSPKKNVSRRLMKHSSGYHLSPVHHSRSQTPNSPSTINLSPISKSPSKSPASLKKAYRSSELRKYSSGIKKKSCLPNHHISLNTSHVFNSKSKSTNNALQEKQLNHTEKSTKNAISKKITNPLKPRQKEPSPKVHQHGSPVRISTSSINASKQKSSERNSVQTENSQSMSPKTMLTRKSPRKVNPRENTPRGDFVTQNQTRAETNGENIPTNLQLQNQNKKILEYIVITLQEIKEIKRILSSPQVDREPLSDFDDEDLPLRTEKDLEDFENAIGNKKYKKKVVNFLSRTGGDNTADITRNALKKLLHLNVAKDLNWIGKNDKIGVSSLQTATVITEAVLKADKDAKECEIHKSIKNWLRDAPAKFRRNK